MKMYHASPRKARKKSVLCGAFLSALIAVLLLGTLFSACNSGKSSVPGLTKKQADNLLAAAEAFYESGVIWDEDTPLAITKNEEFVYYLYNGELTATEGAYAAVPAQEADARIEGLLGEKPALRTHKRAGQEQDYYFMDDNYYVRVNSPASSETKVLSCEKSEEGVYTARISLTGADGRVTELELTFSLHDDQVKVSTCRRFEDR